MAANLRNVDDYLKCTFCGDMFTGEVKLVPNCGNSICDECGKELKDELDSSDSIEFKCKACGQVHEMPRGGFPNNQALMLILKATPVKKPLSERARTLKALVEEIQDRIGQLESTEASDIINLHYDRLQIEVEDAVESAIKHLYEIQKEFSIKINQSRNHTLNSNNEKKGNAQLDLKSNQIKKELSELVKEFDGFNRDWGEYFNRFDTIRSEAEIEDAHKQAQDFNEKLKQLDDRQMEDLFDGMRMVFEADSSFNQNKKHLGNLLVRPFLSPKRMTLEEKPLVTLNDDSNTVFQVVFLPNGNLASCAKDIKIWDVKEGKMLAELKGHANEVNALALLPNGWLASGSLDKTIKLWDLNDMRELRTLTGHTDRVMSLTVLKNGNLVSCSFDESIRIWNPYLEANNHLVTMKSHGNKTILILRIGVLANGNLVSCSYDETTLRVWDPASGNLVKSVPIQTKFAKSLVVLHNDRIAVGFACGLIEMLDLNDLESSKIDKTHSEFLAMAQLANGDLLTTGKDEGKHTIKMWDINENTMLHNFFCDHASWIYSIANYNHFVATASQDKTIKIWRAIETN